MLASVRQTVLARLVAPPRLGLVAWYRGDSLVAASAGVAGTWLDKTPNAYHLTANNSPTIVVTANNARVAARCVAASTQWFQRATTPAVAQPYTSLTIARANAGGGRQMVDSNATAASGGFYEAAPAVVGLYANGTAGMLGTTAPGAWHLHEFTFNGTSSRIAVDNIQEVADGSDVGTGGLTGLRVGRSFFDGFPFDGDIAEVMIYDHILSFAERNDIYAYYRSYYTMPK